MTASKIEMDTLKVQLQSERRERVKAQDQLAKTEAYLVSVQDLLARTEAERDKLAEEIESLEFNTRGL